MIYINNTIKESIVDGEGLRYVIFVQGCPHHCRNCHNPSTWDFRKGKWVMECTIAREIASNPLLDGITFSGGEPFGLESNQKALIRLADFAHKKGLNVWCYTGYNYEEIKDKELTKHVDVIVDGKFIEELKCYGGFKGSSNQRVIRVNS